MRGGMGAGLALAVDPEGGAYFIRRKIGGALVSQVLAR